MSSEQCSCFQPGQALKRASEQSYCSPLGHSGMLVCKTVRNILFVSLTPLRCSGNENLMKEYKKRRLYSLLLGESPHRVTAGKTLVQPRDQFGFLSSQVYNGFTNSTQHNVTVNFHDCSYLGHTLLTMPEQELPHEAVKPADALYNQCSRKAEGTVFFQRDLANMQIADTMAELTMLLQELCDRHLMKLMMLEGEPCWKLRSQSEANR